MRAVLLALLLLSVPALAGQKHQRRRPPARKAAPKVRKPAAPKDPARPSRETGQTAMA